MFVKYEIISTIYLLTKTIPNLPRRIVGNYIKNDVPRGNCKLCTRYIIDNK